MYLLTERRCARETLPGDRAFSRKVEGVSPETDDRDLVSGVKVEYKAKGSVPLYQSR